MIPIDRWLWSEIWWTWDRPQGAPYTIQDIACHYFNLFEAAVWFLFSVLVMIRWSRHRRSSLELVYALAFLVFGVTDVIEAWSLTSWLLWWKLLNLLLLLRLRYWVLHKLYPEQRLY